LGLGTLPEIIVCEHSRLKLCHAEKKPHVDMIRKPCHLLMAKWKTVLWSEKSQFEILFGNHGIKQEELVISTRLKY